MSTYHTNVFKDFIVSKWQSIGSRYLDNLFVITKRSSELDIYHSSFVTKEYPIPQYTHYKTKLADSGLLLQETVA